MYVQSNDDNSEQSIELNIDNVLTKDGSEVIKKGLGKSIIFILQHPILIKEYLFRSGSDKYPKNMRVEQSKNGEDLFLIDVHEDDTIIQESFTIYKCSCFTFQICSIIKITLLDYNYSSLSFVEFFEKVFLIMNKYIQ